MEIGSPVEDRAANRDAYGTAKIAHDIERPARIFEALRRQAAKAEVTAGATAKT